MRAEWFGGAALSRNVAGSQKCPAPLPPLLSLQRQPKQLLALVVFLPFTFQGAAGLVPNRLTCAVPPLPAEHVCRAPCLRGKDLGQTTNVSGRELSVGRSRLQVLGSLLPWLRPSAPTRTALPPPARRDLRVSVILVRCWVRTPGCWSHPADAG